MSSFYLLVRYNKLNDPCYRCSLIRVQRLGLAEYMTLLESYIFS